MAPYIPIFQLKQFNLINRSKALELTVLTSSCTSRVIVLNFCEIVLEAWKSSQGFFYKEIFFKKSHINDSYDVENLDNIMVL